MKISENQALERWDVLPQTLREALYSDINSDFLWKTCEGEFVPDAKIYTVSRIVGYVLMGFLHPEDMSAEIASALQIDRRIADVIASAINQRIFVPLRTEIDKVYDPTVRSAEPKILDETSSGVPTPPAPTQIFPQTFGLGSTAGTPLSDKGWSTLRASVVAGKNQPPAPMPAPVPMASQNLAAQPPIPKPMPPPAPSMLVQRADVPKPIKNAPDFHAPMSTENVMTGKQSVPIPVKPVVLEMAGMPRPAIGKNPGTPQNPPSSTALNASDAASAKTIHYGGLTSSLPVRLPTTTSKPVPEAGRSVVEVTAQNQSPMAAVTPSLIKPAPMSNQTPIPTMFTPKPQAVPMPKPVIPTPAAISQQNVPRPAPAAPPKPMPQQMPGGNVIVKDFTA